jgi:hypothetical protein
MGWHPRVAGEVMDFDVLKVCSLGEGGLVPVEVFEPLVKVRIGVSNHVGTLEMALIDDVVPDDGRVEANVGFRQTFANKVGLALEQLV